MDNLIVFFGLNTGWKLDEILNLTTSQAINYLNIAVDMMKKQFKN